MKKCNKICADPDLIQCLDYAMGNDQKCTENAIDEQIEFIKNCPLRKRYICKWSKKELDSWDI